MEEEDRENREDCPVVQDGTDGFDVGERSSADDSQINCPIGNVVGGSAAGNLMNSGDGTETSDSMSAKGRGAGASREERHADDTKMAGTDESRDKPGKTSGTSSDVHNAIENQGTAASIGKKEETRMETSCPASKCEDGVGVAEGDPDAEDEHGTAQDDARIPEYSSKGSERYNPTCSGRCSDCILKAVTKRRKKAERIDVALCADCNKLHEELSATGEVAQDMFLTKSQKKKNWCPLEKRVPWECKIGLDFTPKQQKKYIVEKYLKKSPAFDNLDEPIDDNYCRCFPFLAMTTDGIACSRPGVFKILFPPNAGVEIEAPGHIKIHHDADVIRYVSLAHNDDETFLIQLSIDCGEWKIENYFFSMSDSTAVYSAINVANRMMYLFRRRDGKNTRGDEAEAASDMLHLFQPLNRMCPVKVTKKLASKTSFEVKLLWCKTLICILDAEYLWMKETLGQEDEPVLLGFYEHEDKDKPIVDEIRLKRRKNDTEYWIKTYITTTDGYEYMLEGTKPHDKDYHFLKSRLTRTPLNKDVLKSTDDFVDVTKLVLERQLPASYAVHKHKRARQRRLQERAGGSGEDATILNFVDEDMKTKVTHDTVANALKVSLASTHETSSKAAQEPEVLSLYDRPVVEVFKVGGIDAEVMPELSPDDGDLKSKWEALRGVYNSKEDFPKSAFDHLGLNPNNLDGYRMCVEEVKTKFRTEEYENVIDYASATVDIFKDSTNPIMKAETRESSLLKFIFKLLFKPTPAPAVPTVLPRSSGPPALPTSSREVDLGDVPDLAPTDEKMVSQWESFREHFRKKKVFETNVLDQSAVNPHDEDEFNEYVGEIQLSYLTNDYERVIDLSRAMMDVYQKSDQPAIKMKCNQTSLFRFIYQIIFGSHSESEGTVPSLAPADPPRIEVADIPDLAPEDDGMKAMWEDFRQVYKARDSFPADALKDVNPNHTQGFLDNVEAVQTNFFCGNYDHVINLARAMMDTYQGSTIEEAEDIATERNLLRFIYKIIFR